MVAEADLLCVIFLPPDSADLFFTEFTLLDMFLLLAVRVGDLKTDNCSGLWVFIESGMSRFTWLFLAPTRESLECDLSHVVSPVTHDLGT